MAFWPASVTFSSRLIVLTHKTKQKAATTLHTLNTLNIQKTVKIAVLSFTVLSFGVHPTILLFYLATKCDVFLLMGDIVDFFTNRKGGIMFFFLLFLENPSFGKLINNIYEKAWQK